jgi:hypothetical protein
MTVAISSSMAQQPDIGPWPPLSSPSIRGLIPGFETLIFLTVRGRRPLAQPPTWRPRVSLLAWIIIYRLLFRLLKGALSTKCFSIECDRKAIMDDE